MVEEADQRGSTDVGKWTFEDIMISEQGIYGKHS